jgi:uncharacterized protein (TIGR02646 family)
VIKITKPKTAPAVLRNWGARKRDAHCADYLANKAEYDAGKRKFAFDSTIYGHRTVKEALLAAQHKKCCFCERMTGNDGDVEHFRPKSGWRQSAGGKLNLPGYYWLAYDWNNLFLSCSACNQRHKRNHFPLANPVRRARIHTDDITQESALFINPAEQDPEEYIGFRKEIAYAKKGSRIGKTTYTQLDLNRDILREERLTRLKELGRLQDVVCLADVLTASAEGARVVNEARAELANAVTDAGEFAAMARAAAKNGFTG